MLSVVLCVCVRHFPRPAVLRREFVFPGRLWLTFRPLRRGAVSLAISDSRTYRSELVRSRACCARRVFSGTAFRRGFRFAASVGGSLRALRPRAAIFPALCEWTRACWPASLVLPRRAPGGASGTEDFPCGAAGSLITLRRRTKAKKRLTMALQRTAPGGSGLSQPVLLRPARHPIRGGFPALHRWAQAAPARSRPPRSLSLSR